MLQVEVMPGYGIRNDYIELLLGMPVNQAIAAIQNASRHIQNVELTYSFKVCHFLQYHTSSKCYVSYFCIPIRRGM